MLLVSRHPVGSYASGTGSQKAPSRRHASAGPWRLTDSFTAGSGSPTIVIASLPVAHSAFSNPKQFLGRIFCILAKVASFMAVGT